VRLAGFKHHGASETADVGANKESAPFVARLSLNVKRNPVVAGRGKEGHFGLQGMRERAARIAGKLTVISSPESGTHVKLVVPGKIIYRKSTSDNH
jgi:nitrate/nitrite-specific signal transduction histidine kinase